MSISPSSIPAAPGPLTVRVKEPADGLFYWVVSRLSNDEHGQDLHINASDHPYPTHEAALNAGAACLKALKAFPSLL